jgi:hypothetical protein
MKKFKTSENEQSHGSFFLRVGGLGTVSCTGGLQGFGNLLLLYKQRPGKL